MSRPKPTRVVAVVTLVFLIAATTTTAGELSVEDFTFDGPLGSHGAKIEKLGANHFAISLGHAPEHPDWCNMLYFQMKSIAQYYQGVRPPAPEPQAKGEPRERE